MRETVVCKAFIHLFYFPVKMRWSLEIECDCNVLCLLREKVCIKILYNTYWYAVRLMILSCHVYADFFDIRLQDQT